MHGEGKFLITFSPADISEAHNADQIFSQTMLKKRLGGLRSSTLEEFVDSGEYHKARGEYVFGKVQEHHDNCKV